MNIGHYFTICALLNLLLLSHVPPVFCQVLHSIGPPEKSVDRLPDSVEQKTTTETPVQILPPPPVPPKESTGALLKDMYAREIVVTGSTVFTREELERVTAPYENRSVTMEDLESVRRELTLLYINKGYINSGVVIPDQTVVDGLITLQVIEGKLTAIDLEGRWFGDDYLRDRIALGAKTPVDVHALQNRLQLLQQDQRIQRIQAELRPGANLGESVLKVKVEEKPPYSVWFALNNYQSPSVGGEQGLISLAHQNVSGRGDILSLTYGGSSGVDYPLIDFWYARPINVHDTTLQFRYRKDNFGVVDDVFGPLDIVTKSESYEVNLRQPLYRTLTQEFALGLSLEYETNKNTLLGEPFSFTPGEENGKSIVVPLRFLQEWTYRTQRQVIAVRSRLSVGLDTWDATINPDKDIPDGKFVSWLGQFQWVRLTDILDSQLLFRADLQLSDQSLLPIEQIGVGGRYSVRGYRENSLVSDQAFITSLEARIPIVQNKRWADYLQVCPFFDYGRATNKDIPDPSPKDISSVGVGFRWAATGVKSPVTFKPEVEFYWGYALREIDQSDEDLQDSGIHFQISLTGYW